MNYSTGKDADLAVVVPIVEPTPEAAPEAAPEDNAQSPEDGKSAAFNPETGEINWDCPCLGGMASGPCGEAFKAAFSCFIYSQQEPKGVDCIDNFRDMQDCFRLHPEIYGNEIDDDEDDEEEEEEEGEDAEADGKDEKAEVIVVEEVAAVAAVTAVAAAVVEEGEEGVDGDGEEIFSSWSSWW